MWAWLEKVMNEDYSKPLDLSKVKKGCWHDWRYEHGEICCIYCGLIKQKEICIVVDRTVNYQFWPRTYLRKQYFDALFNKIKGREALEIGDGYRDELIAAVPEPADWYQVYQVFKEFYLKDWWTAWNVICWRDKEIDFETKHYNLLVYVDNHWDESTRSKKKINVFYTLFKIVEMTDCNTKWVPMKLRPIALTRLDSEWKLICEKFNWKFIPTSKKLKAHTWKF